MRRIYPEKRRAYIKKFYGPAIDFPEFSQEDIDIFVQSFREFDLDNSGTISSYELGEAFKSMGQGVHKEEIDMIFKMIEVDPSGEIEWKDYLKIMRFMYPQKRVKFVKNFYVPARQFPEFTKGDIDAFVTVFRTFDLDGSGGIDAQELALLLAAMGQGASQQQVTKVLSSVTLNKFGEIEWPAFLQIMRSFYPNKLKEFEEAFYGPAKKFPQFSKDEIDVFVEAFWNFDLDGSSSIDARELGLALKCMGQGATQDQVKQILQKYDADGSGEIEWPEFLTIMSDLYSERQTTTPSVQTVVPVADQPKQTAPTQTTPKQTAPTQTTPKQTAPTQTTPKQTAPISPKIQIGASKIGGNPKCESCGKTVYAIEAIGITDRTWHKGCFKCEGEGCGVTLNVKTFTVVDAKVYCSKHVPKHKPTSLKHDGSITSLSAISAPKVNKAMGIKKDNRQSFGAFDD